MHLTWEARATSGGSGVLGDFGTLCFFFFDDIESLP
jgi:hypothetical protein